MCFDLADQPCGRACLPLGPLLQGGVLGRKGPPLDSGSLVQKVLSGGGLVGVEGEGEGEGEKEGDEGWWGRKKGLRGGGGNMCLGQVDRGEEKRRNDFACL